MKNVKTLFAIALSSIFALSYAPRLSGEGGCPDVQPLTVSVEIGRYDPEPNCRKDVDGCSPKHWVSTREFSSGTPVWMKVTITNRSKMNIVDATGPKNAWIVSVVDANGKTPELTKEGCWSRIPTCPYPRDNTLMVITAAPPRYWAILPAASVTLFIEVSHDFVLQSQGEYTLSSEITGFSLTPKEFFDQYHFDEKQAKPIAALKMKAIKFTVLE